MATRYALQQVGVSDGTKFPPDKADGRQVNARSFSLLASKQSGDAWNDGDTVVLGRIPAGHKVVGIRATTDTSWSTSTISIGTAGTPAKYVSAKTLTATNVPTALGPLASTLDDAPLAAAEDLIATIGVANIGGAVLATIEVETVAIG